MVEISASMVKELRDKSGAAMMDCKKALVESSGDLDKAFEWLRQKGVATASKKAGRATSEGLVVGLVSSDNKSGVLLELNCETDFVARNENFVELANELAREALTAKAKDADEFLNKSGAKEKITASVAKTGENMQLARLTVLDVGGANGVIGLYVHALGGKMGAVVEIETSSAGNSEQVVALARELAMHIVSAKPQYLSKEEVPAEIIENEKRIESGKADLAEKKPEMRDKIVQGRVDKILAERCLMEQPFVKDPGQSVSKYLQTKGKELGTELKPKRFALYILGESQSESSNGKEEG